MKKAFKVLAIAAIAIAVLPSCKKGDVKAKRLDGDWALVSGTGSTTTTYLDKNTGVSTSYTSSQTFNGTTIVTSQTVSGVTTSITTPFIVEWTFNKDDNSYESHATTGSQYTGFFYFYPNSNCDFFDGISGDQKVETKTVAHSQGTFTILGETGEIEKNSRILTTTSSTESVVTTTFTYLDGSVVQGTVYYLDGSTCKVAPTSKTETYNESSVNDSGTIVTVTEMDKESMKTETEVNESDEDLDDKTTTTGTYSFGGLFQFEILLLF